jgi:hypothetical protein
LLKRSFLQKSSKNLLFRDSTKVEFIENLANFLEKAELFILKLK